MPAWAQTATRSRKSACQRMKLSLTKITGAPASCQRRRSPAIRRAASSAPRASEAPPSNSKVLIMSMISSADWLIGSGRNEMGGGSPTMVVTIGARPREPVRIPSAGHPLPESPMKLRTALPTLCLLAALPSAALAERGLEGKDLATMDRVSSPVLSPDGARVVFALRTVDFEADSASTALYMRDLRTRDMRPPHQVTPAGWSVSSPAFSPDGSTLYFFSAKNGSQQLYAMPLAGGEPRQLTDFAVGIGTWQLSPQGDRIAFTTDVFPDCGADFACTQSRLDERKESKATGVLYDQLFVRHWDTWKDGRQSKLFAADLPAADGEPVTQATGLSLALAGDIPAKPFGGASDYAWAPDGRSLAVSVKPVEGSEQAWST